jgi:flagellar biosynthetic protein FliP
MSGAGWAGIAGTLAMVVALILVLARLARRFVPGAIGADLQGVRVVQRIALGQKQSIAVVEIAGRRIALGVGEGGVRQLFTIDDEAPGDAARTPATRADDAVRAVAPVVPQPGRAIDAMRETMRDTPRGTMRDTPLEISLVAGTPARVVTPVASPVTPDAARAAVPSPTDWLRRIPAAAVPPRRDTPVRIPSTETLAAIPAPLIMPTPLMVPAIAATPLPTLAEVAASRRAAGPLDDVFAAAERVTTPAPRPALAAVPVAPRRGWRQAEPEPAAARPARPLPDYVRGAAMLAAVTARDTDGAIARTLEQDPSFGDALKMAMRGVAMLAVTTLLAVAPQRAAAQAVATPASAAAAPATPAPAIQGATGGAAQPAALPANVTPAGAGGGFRPVPAGAARPGPRDLPRRADATVTPPRPDRPARTAAPGGGVPTIAPLVPAQKAADIAALRARATGAAPLTTPEAQRMARKADSALAAVAPSIDLQFGKSAGGEGLRLSGTVGVVIMMGLLSLLPFLLLMMTAFTRVLVVLSFLKQALGTQGTPPGQLIAALALVISGFVMAPTLREVNTVALEPWMEGRIEQVEMMKQAIGPFRTFMLAQVGDKELQAFVDLAEIPQPKTREEVPLVVLMSAFATSELRTAFQIGFALFLPFIVVDVVVSAVLMSMGMMMLPPAMIALPFKLLLFVLVDGWSLVVTGLVQSFR